ncbi:MAG TPA: extracellular solute-binding protein [Candidatus Bathyarchaeia archaeon]|nr:extracellular solute-binding protein [Candidatus Bathyarchaeia archaeon]
MAAQDNQNKQDIFSQAAGSTQPASGKEPNSSPAGGSRSSQPLPSPPSDKPALTVEELYAPSGTKPVSSKPMVSVFAPPKLAAVSAGNLSAAGSQSLVAAAAKPKSLSADFSDSKPVSVTGKPAPSLSTAAVIASKAAEDSRPGPVNPAQRPKVPTPSSTKIPVGKPFQPVPPKPEPAFKVEELYAPSEPKKDVLKPAPFSIPAAPAKLQSVPVPAPERKDAIFSGVKSTEEEKAKIEFPVRETFSVPSVKEVTGQRQMNPPPVPPGAVRPELPVPAVVPVPKPVGGLSSEKPPLIPSQPKKLPTANIFKVLLIFLAVVILAGGGYLIFKTFGKKKPDGEETLVYWGLWEDVDILETVTKDWEKDHPQVKINYLRQAKEEYRERLQSALARNEGPDIFRFHNTWLPMLKDELSPMPANIMTTAQFEETFYPVAVSDLKIGTSIYGVPLEIDTLALFYNEDIFRAAGKNPPTNWDELRRLASELTVRDSGGQVQIAGAAMGVTSNIDHWSDILGLMMLQNGVDLAKPRGKLAEDALLFYSYINKRDRVWNTNLPNSTLAFASGKVAMYFGFSWDIFEIERVNKELKYKIVPVPQLPEREPVAWASYWVEGVSRRSKKQEQAWEFLKYLSSEETMIKLYKAQSDRRLFGEPYSRKNLSSQLSNDPLVGPFINQAIFAKSWYLCSRTFDNGINEMIIKYFEDAVNTTGDTGTSAGDTLQTVAKGVSQVLSRYRVSAQ